MEKLIVYLMVFSSLQLAAWCAFAESADIGNMLLAVASVSRGYKSEVEVKKKLAAKLKSSGIPLVGLDVNAIGSEQRPEFLVTITGADSTTKFRISDGAAELIDSK